MLPEVMHARTHGPVWNREPELRDEMVKRLTDRAGADGPTAAEREDRCRRCDRLGHRRATREVITQRLAKCAVQRGRGGSCRTWSVE
jgi:hypothetical protein